MAIGQYQRFSLRCLLAIVTLLCVWIGILSIRAHNQRRAVSAIRAAGGDVVYSHQSQKWSDEPSWLRGVIADVLGQEWAYSVWAVIIHPDANQSADELVRSASLLTNLEHMAIWPGERGAKSFSDQAPGGLTDEGVDFILATFPRLKHLSTHAAHISDGKIDELLQRGGWTGIQISLHRDAGNESAVDTWTDRDGSRRIVDLRKTSTRIQELVNDLLDSGFKLVPDRVRSNRREFAHKDFPGTVTFHGSDGDYARKVQVIEVKQAIEKVAK